MLFELEAGPFITQVIILAPQVDCLGPHLVHGLIRTMNFQA